MLLSQQQHIRYQTRQEGQEYFKPKLYFRCILGGSLDSVVALFCIFFARELLAANRELKAALTTIANICKDQKISDEMNKMSALKQPDL
jgi:hypothetical protein